MKEMLKPADVAPMLGVTTARVYQLMRDGVLPYVRLGRGVRIPKPAWEAWLSGQTADALESIGRRKTREQSEV